MKLGLLGELSHFVESDIVPLFQTDLAKTPEFYARLLYVNGAVDQKFFIDSRKEFNDKFDELLKANPDDGKVIKYYIKMLVGQANEEDLFVDPSPLYVQFSVY